MPSPKFLDLRLIYRRKAPLLKKLEKYVKPINEFKGDPALAEFRQQEDHIILEHHHFSSDKGLLPLVDGLIAVNDEILSYESPDFVGQIKDKYDKMIESVKKEQNFLKILFKPTLEDVVKRKGYKEYWEKSFSGYKKLLERVQLSLTYLLWLLHIEAAAVVSNILNLISQAKLDEVIAFIENEESAKLLSDKEVDFFKKLISAAKDKRYDEIDAILEEGRGLIEDEEYQVLMWIFNLDVEITSINSGESKESIEIIAGDEITITANVKCGFIPTGCKAFLRIHQGDDKPWTTESVIQTVDRSKRIFSQKNVLGTLQYEAAFEFKLETTELIAILNETANGHIFIVAQSQLCKKTKQINVKINPNHAERIRRELERAATDKVPDFTKRRRFRIEDEPVKRVPPPSPELHVTPPPSPQAFAELERIGFQILDMINVEGSAHRLSRLPALEEWLQQNYPQVKAKIVSDEFYDRDSRRWYLIVLTIDDRYGIVIPALDTTIGPSGLEWFRGNRYDGTQYVHKQNVLQLAKGEYTMMHGKNEWICIEKGIINLDRKS